MAKLRANYREPFDRERDFVTSRSLPVSGRVFTPGERFDKTLVTDRRLRQMYEQRILNVEPKKLDDAEKSTSKRAQRVRVQRKRAASNRTKLDRELA